MTSTNVLNKTRPAERSLRGCVRRCVPARSGQSIAVTSLDGTMHEASTDHNAKWPHVYVLEAAGSAYKAAGVVRTESQQ